MKKGSVILSTVFVMLFLAVLIILTISLPCIWPEIAWRLYLPEYNANTIFWAFYGCAPFAMTALICLLKLLQNIRSDQPFSYQTGKLMAIISWCCVAVAGVTGIACPWYPPLALMMVAMLFMFLIVRVVRICFLAATELKEDNSLTI